jgi:hypothetical protein
VQNEQRHTAEADLAAAATAAAAVEAAKIIAVAEAAVKAEEAAAVKAEEAATKAAAKAAASCQICFEPYGSAVVPRILVACGHTFCEECISTMLRCAEHTRTQAS